MKNMEEQDKKMKTFLSCSFAITKNGQKYKIFCALFTKCKEEYMGKKRYS